jgi:excisionase family DNA binding protein
MLTAAAVAKILGISQRAVYDLAATGALPSHKPTAGGRAVRFDPADVEAHKAASPTPAGLLPARTFRTYERLRIAAEKAGATDLPRLSAAQQALAEKRVRNMRTPPWADRQAIAAVYAEAKRLTAATGIEHHVDHEIPLCGEFVSGLHVHQNLRPMPAAYNIRKGNRFES